MVCRRCGFCCMSLPSWKNLSELDKATIRQLDPEAEILFNQVVDGVCPNLDLDTTGIRSKCKIYNKRFKFCRALKYNSNQCKFARGIIQE